MPFAMGIFVARYEKKRDIIYNNYLLFITIFVSALFVIVGSLWFISWLAVPLFIITGAVATVRLLPERLLKCLVWFGGVSASLFVIHPLLRELIISRYMGGAQFYYTGILIYVLSSVSAAMLYHHVFKKLHTA